jgi:CrcB protein
MIKNLLLVSAGGIFGSCLRYAVSMSANNLVQRLFPFGTLLVNSLGGFMAGVVLGFSSCLWYTKNVQLFVLVGFLGAFTTFSAYNIETINLFFEGKAKLGLLNILLNNILSLVLVFLGFWLTKALFLKVD